MYTYHVTARISPTPRGEICSAYFTQFSPLHPKKSKLFTMAAAYGDLRHLLPGNYKRLISEWLEEDCPSFDYGGFVVGESEGEARLLGKSKVSHSYGFQSNIA